MDSFTARSTRAHADVKSFAEISMHCAALLHLSWYERAYGTRPHGLPVRLSMHSPWSYHTIVSLCGLRTTLWRRVSRRGSTAVPGCQVLERECAAQAWGPTSGMVAMPASSRVSRCSAVYSPPSGDIGVRGVATSPALVLRHEDRQGAVELPAERHTLTC